MRVNRFVTMVLTVSIATAAGAAERAPQGAGSGEDPRLGFLKQLEGTWVAQPPAGSDEPAGVFEFRVTAGGHAVEEREFVGTPMEMLTVYHMDGRDLVATHYCMLGNRPRVRAAREIVDDTLSFACAGKPGNAASHADKHVHGWSMRLDGDGRLHYSAELVEAGDVTETPGFVLTRR